MTQKHETEQTGDERTAKFCGHCISAAESFFKILDDLITRFGFNKFENDTIARRAVHYLITARDDVKLANEHVAYLTEPVILLKAENAEKDSEVHGTLMAIAASNVLSAFAIARTLEHDELGGALTPAVVIAEHILRNGKL